MQYPSLALLNKKTKILSLLFLFISLSFASFSQTIAQKECRISSGIGLGGATLNTKSPGINVWIQLAYQLSENVSVATEFDNMTYTKPGYYSDLPISPNEIKAFDNNFSLLLKYHFPIKSKLKVNLASGWTFMTRQEDYYIYENNGTDQHTFRNVSSFSDFRIPFLLEIEYPLYKKLNVQARAKYNLNEQNGNTYSSGIGLSLKL